MDQTEESKSQRGRKTASMIARKAGQAIALHCLHRAVATWLANLVGDDEAASPARTALTAIVKLGTILFGLTN